jgi:4-cresol dehydrogenase (hydroxylating)
VLLDLGRMNRIVDFDEALAYVAVEPGVSFGDLYAFLRDRGSRLFASTVGAGPGASVLGNAIERGDGSGPNGDRWSHVCALEAVLPTGEVVHTGPDRFPGARTASVLRWGPGPALDGLFSQSNLGVVTRLGIWLTPLPGWIAAVRFSVADPARLPAVVDVCRVLRMEGTLRAVVGFWNDYRVLSTHRQYPWDLTGGETPLGRPQIDALRAEQGGAAWFGSTAIYAPTALQGRAALERVRAALRAHVDHLSVDARGGAPRSGRELLGGDDPALAFIQGIPHEDSLRSLYWRKRTPIPADLDPEGDLCGAVWTSAAIPFGGHGAIQVTGLLEEAMLRHGFEPMLVMLGQSERLLTVVPLLLYDRAIPGADAAAMACHDDLVARLHAKGLSLSRLGIHSMESLPPPGDDHGALLARLKRALDPNDILAPGRYDFRSTWPRNG